MGSTKKYIIAGIFVLLSGLLFFTSCSTKKNTWTRRAYHNLTAHYNVYWNGMDLMRQGLKDYNSQLKDNFAIVLPVYNNGDKTASNKALQFSDNSIKKASKTIQKHSMFFNNKEYCKWIDDAYMLIGKANFYKKDYGLARRTFEFVIKTYNNNDIKYEAMHWLALTNIEMGDYSRGESMLDMLLNLINKGDAPPSLEEKVNLAYANSFIHQKNYDGAVPYLTRALELKPPVRIKTRVYFILGQIYQKQEDLARAEEMYSKVLKHNLSYEMEFNAKINLAQCYTSSSGNHDYIVKKLTRMLKDEKNKDFQDQIYYALAQIAMKDSDTASAVDFLRKSVSSSKNNNYQRSISALQLADIYFSIPDYQKAQAYYDSTMQFLPKDYPNYSQLKKRTETLTDLVGQLSIIQKEDSLQTLAKMPEEKRNKIIDEAVARYIAAEIKKKQEQQTKELNQMFVNQGESQNFGPTQGRWYFYNAAALANGFSVFGKKWGRRKLEDNWFLTDKVVNPIAGETPADTSKTVTSTQGGDSTQVKKTEPKSTNPKDRKFYTQDIPLTPAKMAVSDKLIQDAYYKSGFIYIEGLNDYGHSVESFETLLERYPDYPRKVQTCYELYLLYRDLKNESKADHYRNMILNEFPESDYAKLIINPNYNKEIIARRSAASRLYEDTYKAFQNQQFYMVISNTSEAHLKYKSDSALLPCFDYLKALSLGKIEVADSMITALNKLRKDYPASPVSALVKDVLASLAGGSTQPGQGGKNASDTSALLLAAESIYKLDPSAIHFYIIIVNSQIVDINALKIKIADFNMKYHDLENLEINSLLFDNSREMITVSNFEDARKSMNYLSSIRESKYVFAKLENTGGYSDFVISVTNYPVLYKNKEVPKYMKFFEKNYEIKN